MSGSENRTLLTKFDLDVLDTTFEVSIYQSSYTPSQIWESRDQWLSFAERSKEYHNNMTPEEREGHQELIKYAIQRLHDKIDTWFPEAIDMSSGTAIDVHFRILVTDAQETIKKHSGITQMKVKEAESESIELLKKFSND